MIVQGHEEGKHLSGDWFNSFVNTVATDFRYRILIYAIAIMFFVPAAVILEFAGMSLNTMAILLSVSLPLMSLFVYLLLRKGQIFRNKE